MKYKRVTKPNARKMYRMGCDILLLPCKVNDSVVDGSHPWVKPVIINSNGCKYDAINKFDRSVNEYEYYNCNAELGYYAHYFVSEEDYNKFKGGISNGTEKSEES